MVRKIAFISSAVVKIPKDFEEKLTAEVDGMNVEYRHPVLYVVRQTRKDKDYIYIYSAKPTFVIMKVKEAHVDKFIECIDNILSIVGIDDGNRHKLASDLLLYCKLSHIIEEIHLDVLKSSKEEFMGLVGILDNFDPLLRRWMVRPLARAIVTKVIKEKAREYYLKIPEDIRARISFGEWMHFVLLEIDKKNVTKSILRELYGSKT